MPTCPGCHREVAAEDAFCRHCGAALRGARPAERQPFMAQMAADFESRLKDRPRDADALYNLGLTHYYCGQYAEAAVCFAEVAELVPDFAANWGKLALCRWHAGKADEARELMAKAVGLAPRDRRLAELLARMREGA